MTENDVIWTRCSVMEFSSLYVSSSQYKPLNAVETSFFENFSCSIACTTTIPSIASRDLAMQFYQNVVKILQDLDKVLVRSYQVLTKILDLRTLQDSYEIFQDLINLTRSLFLWDLPRFHQNRMEWLTRNNTHCDRNKWVNLEITL